jgi:hypothetical protein
VRYLTIEGINAITSGGALFSFTSNGSGNNNRIDTLGYDAAGNVLDDGNHQYTYDAGQFF